jgi:hypothetical protein
MAKLLIHLTEEDLIKILDAAIEKVLSQYQNLRRPIKDDEELLCRKEVAKLLKVSLVTINEWCRKEILYPRRINSRVYFLKSEIMNLLKGDK